MSVVAVDFAAAFLNPACLGCPAYRSLVVSVVL